MNDAPATKIKIMRDSIRCLVFGLLAFVPVIGLPFGLAALWISGRVRQREKRYWNPAKPQRILGLCCAVAGILGWALIVGGIVYSAVNANNRHDF
jgi:hypothetical protein